MTLFKKTAIHTVMFFLYLFSISIKMYSQEQELNPIVYQDTLINNECYVLPIPKYNPIIYQDTLIIHSLSSPFIFDINRLFPGRSFTPENPLIQPLFPPFRISKYKLFADVYHKSDIDRYVYSQLIISNINQIEYTPANLVVNIEPLKEIKPNVFQYIFKNDNNIDRKNVIKPERYNPKRRYWAYTGNHSVQLSQNYISDNWYKGGVKNFNLINTHKVSFTYKKDKIQSKIDAEWKLNLYTNPNDTIRNYRIGDDLIRTNCNFGIQAFNNWSYSTNIEIKTQILKKFTENSHNMLSAAFAPLYVNIGILGMKYQIDKVFPKVKGKKVHFDTDMSPISIEYVTVLDKAIDPQKFGIKEEKWSLTNFGSSVIANLKIDFNKNVNFTSRFYYFTNYEKITAEWENTLNMPINRYFSTKFYLFVRYDDNKKLVPDKTLGYFQIYELLSFGFNYTW